MLRTKHFCLSSNRKSMDFTLIELLVVIAIIAILASILMPALSSARARGKANQCTNNLKQCALAMQLYIEDHKMMPLYYMAGNARTFREMICKESMQRYGTSEQKKRLGGSYLSSEKMVLCPAVFPFVPLDKSAPDPIGSANMGWHISTYGASLHADHHPTSHPAGSDEYLRERETLAFKMGDRAFGGICVRPSFIKNPSRFYMIADGASVKNKRNCPWYWLDFGNSGFAGNHNGRANVAWLDGHVSTNDHGSLRQLMPKTASYAKLFLETDTYNWVQ